MDESQAGRALEGSMTALVTPFSRGEVDWVRWSSLIDRQIEAGTDWLVPIGTTGESPTLSSDERDRLVSVAVDRARGRAGVLVGTGTNGTRETILRSKRAAELGAGAVMVVAPYYNRPSQEGLFRHFSAVAESVDVPMVLYNVPPRTAVTIDGDTIERLVNEHANIAAVKDATGLVTNAADLTARCGVRVLCGDDVLTLPFIALGGCGVISVISNLAPELMKSLVEASRLGALDEARSLHTRVAAIASGLSKAGPNPVGIKTAMAIRGLCEEEFRLPLCPAAASVRRELEEVLDRAEVPKQFAA